VSDLRSELKGEVLVVYFNVAKIREESKVQEIHGELDDVLEDASGGKLLLNLENVTFMSSAMMGKIILLSKKCRANDVTFKLCNITDNVMEVFKYMHLNKVLDIQKDEEKAIESFNKKGWFG